MSAWLTSKKKFEKNLNLEDFGPKQYWVNELDVCGLAGLFGKLVKI